MTVKRCGLDAWGAHASCVLFPASCRELQSHVLAVSQADARVIPIGFLRLILRSRILGVRQGLPLLGSPVSGWLRCGAGGGMGSAVTCEGLEPHKVSRKRRFTHALHSDFVARCWRIFGRCGSCPASETEGRVGGNKPLASSPYFSAPMPSAMAPSNPESSPKPGEVM